MAAGAVPRGLIEKAARAATRSAAAGVSAATLALTEEVIKIMLLKKLTLFAAVLFGSIVVAWAATVALIAGTDKPPTAGAKQATAAVQAVPVPAFARGNIALDDPGKSALHGRVLGPDGKPVAGARVWAQGPDLSQGPFSRELAEARTDAEGRFHLGLVVPRYRNRFQLIVDPPHFARLSIPRSAVLTFPGLDWDLGDIQVDPGRVFTGQVLDFDGKPRPDATIDPRVYRHYLGHSVEDIGPGQTLTTDAEGRFRTPPLPVGRLALMVQVPERQLAGVSRPIHPGGEEDLGTDPPGEGRGRHGRRQGRRGASRCRGQHCGLRRTQGDHRRGGQFHAPRVRAESVFPDEHAQGGLCAPRREGDRHRGWHPVRHARRLEARSADQGTGRDPERRVGWIEGQAVDAEPASRFAWRGGRVEFRARARRQGRPARRLRADFEQPEPGRFRASFPAPDEYHLTFSAPGYHDAEAYTPKATELKTIGGIVARMKRKTEGSAPAIAARTITGTVSATAGRSRPAGSASGV